MAATEIKYCPGCQAPFTCNRDNIRQCECYTIRLTAEQRIWLEQQFNDCLCNNCLNRLQAAFEKPEKK